jgi:hypothetical protein
MSGFLSGILPSWLGGRDPTPANPQPLDTNVQPTLGPRSRADRIAARDAADSIGQAQQQAQVDARAKLTENARKTLPSGSLATSVPPEEGFTPTSQKTEEAIAWDQYAPTSPIQDGVFSPSIAPKIDIAALVAKSIKPNPLDEYNNYTYHVKFWVSTEKNSETISSTSKHAVDNIPKIVIAESGVTAGFNIREFTFRNLTGTTGLTRNMPSVNWTMVITEPLGFSLPDRIRSSAQAYGINNWQRGKYFIEVYFTGYNEDGSPVASGLFYKLYRVTITDMTLGGTESGATYEITGLFDGQHGFENTVAMSDKTVVIGATKVGEFFSKLTDALNTNAVRLALGTAPLTKYEFVLPNDFKSWDINPGKVLENDQYASNMTPKRDGNEVKLTISSGTDVGQMVYYVISLANQAEAWMLGTDSTSSSQGMPLNSIRKNIKLHCQMEYIGFDTYAGDYVKKITYTLIPYEEVRVRDDIPSVRKAEGAAIQAEKILYMLRNGRIAKKYEWIYTGQNLDIIRFDFKINHFWTISTPAYGGFNTASNAVQGAVTAENSAPWAAHDLRYRTAVQKAKELDDRKSSLQKYLANPLVPDILKRSNPGVSRDVFDARNKLQADIANAKAELASVQQEIKDNAAAREAAELRTRADAFVSFTDPVAGALGSNTLVNQILQSNAKLTTAFNQGGIFAEDQKILDVDTTMPFFNTVKPNREANSANTNQGTASAKPQDTSKDPLNLPVSRTLFGAVTGNFDSINKEMMNISMDIRGDPYWMGHGNVEQNAKVPDKLNELSKDYVELLGGDNMFYLKFRSGQIQNEDTGYMDFTGDTQVVDGYYSVWEVTNTFKEGQFIQTLKSFKDTQSQHANPIMKSIEARKLSESNQKVQSGPSSPSAVPSIYPAWQSPGDAPAVDINGRSVILPY